MASVREEWPVRMRDANGAVCEVGMGGGMHMKSGPSMVGGLAQNKGSPIHRCTCPQAPVQTPVAARLHHVQQKNARRCDPLASCP